MSPKHIVPTLVVFCSLILACYGSLFTQIANMTSGQNYQAITWLENLSSTKGDITLSLELPSIPSGDDAPAQIEKITLVAFEMRETKIYLTKELTKDALKYGEGEEGKNEIVFKYNDYGFNTVHFYALVQYSAYQQSFTSSPIINKQYTSQKWSLAITLPGAQKSNQVVSIIPQWFKSIGDQKQTKGENVDTHSINSEFTKSLPSISLSKRNVIVDQLSTLLYGSSISTRASMIPGKASDIDVYGINLANLPSFVSNPGDDIAKKIRRISFYIHGPGWIHSVRQSNPYPKQPNNNNGANEFDASPELVFAGEQGPCQLNLEKSQIYTDAFTFLTNTQHSQWTTETTPVEQLLLTNSLQLECLNGVFLTFKQFTDKKHPNYNEVIAKMPIFISIQPLGGPQEKVQITDFGVLTLQLNPVEGGGYEYVKFNEYGPVLQQQQQQQLSTQQQSQQSTSPYIYNTTSYYHSPSPPFSTVGSLVLFFDIIFPTDGYNIDEFFHETNDSIIISMIGPGLNGITTSTKGQISIIPTPLYLDPVIPADTVKRSLNDLDGNNEEPVPYIYNTIIHDELDFNTTPPTDDKTKSLQIPLKKIFATRTGVDEKTRRDDYSKFSSTSQLNLHCFIVIEATLESSFIPSQTTSYPQLLVKYFHAQGGESDGFKSIYHPITMVFNATQKMEEQSSSSPLSIQQSSYNDPIISKFDMYIHSTLYPYISITNPSLYTLRGFDITINSGHFLATIPHPTNPGFNLIHSDPNSNQTSINHLCMVACKMDVSDSLNNNKNNNNDSTQEPACSFPQQPTLTYNHHTNTISVANLTHYIKGNTETDAKPIYVFRCNSKKTHFAPAPSILTPSSPTQTPSFNNHVEMTITTDLTYINPPQLGRNITTTAQMFVVTNREDVVSNLPPSLLGRSPRSTPLGPDDGLGPDHDEGYPVDSKKSNEFVILSVVLLVLIVVAAICAFVWKKKNQYGPGLNESNDYPTIIRRGLDHFGYINSGSDNIEYIGLSDVDLDDDERISTVTTTPKAQNSPKSQSTTRQHKVLFIEENESDRNVDRGLLLSDHNQKKLR